MPLEDTTNTGGPPLPRIQYSRFTAAPEKRKGRKKKKRNKQFTSLKTRTKLERDVTLWNPAAQTRPVLDSPSFVPVPTLPRKL